MSRFWKFLLRKSHPPSILSNIHFAVFGLGDSSYPKFNFPAKKLFKRLLSLGAKLLIERGDGDDQHYLGIDGALDPWLEQLWAKIMGMWPLPSGMEIQSADVVPQPSFEVRFLEDGLDDVEDVLLEDLALTELQRKNEGLARVKVNKRITAEDHFQDVRHFEFDIDENHSYSAGDVMVIRPQNLPDEVQLVLDHFGWADIADKPFILVPTNADIRVPPHWGRTHTLRYLLEHHLDILGRPRRYFFELLSFFTTDPLHAEKLREFASPTGQDELYSYSHRPKRTTFEILQDFHSTKIPLKYLFDLIPEMRPRSFSIASSPKAHPRKIHLCVAIVEYKTKMKAPRQGVCTKWMKGLKEGDRIRFVIKRGTMRLPSAADAPLVMIGPGTGVAPMRSFLEERICDGSEDNMLFFGCRNREMDYLYQEEFEFFEREGGLALSAAFSRDQVRGCEVHLFLHGNDS